MNTNQQDVSRGEPSPRTAARRVDEICLRFEEAWKAGLPPRVEDFLGDATGPERTELLRQLLLMDLEYVHLTGRGLALEDYLARFPDQEALIREAASGGMLPTIPPTTSLPGHSPRLPGLSLQLPCRFGDYDLIEKIQSGGQGVVYRARQLGPNGQPVRTVALKMVLMANETRAIERFRFEAEAAATLDHRNVVPIYDIGEINSQPYFTMKLLEGGSLTDRLRERTSLLPHEAARLVLEVTRGVHHAHQRGVLHRDLKPANILLNAAGEPHVSDFGLARRIEAEHSLNPDGAVAGTLPYMAPEQARGEKVTIATDVYGLGAILYECLTGRSPFQGPLAAVFHQVLEQDPVSPRRLNSRIDRRLEAICLKCLRKLPSERYSSAEELAADLDNYLHNRRVAACSFRLRDVLASVFNTEHDEGEFYGWMGPLLLLYAPLFLVWWLIQFWAIETGQPTGVVWGSLFAGYAPLFAIFRFQMSGRLVPAGVAGRHLWTVWIGHLLALTALVVAAAQDSNRTAAEQLQGIYPAYGALAGLTMFVQGTLFWGRHYAFGLVHFPLTPLLALWPRWAPLLLGLLGTANSFAIGFHLIRLHRRHANDSR